MEDFEDKVLGTMVFIDSVTKRELAEFIVHQSNAIDGLGKNLDSYVKEFRKMYNPSVEADAAKKPPCRSL